MMCSQQKSINTDKEKRCYAQNPNIAERSIDDTVFLVNPDTDIVYYLDSLGAGIWQLLKDPVSMSDVANIVKQAFPATPAQEIARDVKELINEMCVKNLVLNHV